MKFNSEMVRKDKLLDALILLEMVEQDRKRIYSITYDKQYEGIATVLDVQPTNLRLEREDERRNINLVVTEEVSKLVRKGDDLILKAGRHEGKWYLQFVMMICTPTGDGQVLVSIRNPERAEKMMTVN